MPFKAIQGQRLGMDHKCDRQTDEQTFSYSKGHDQLCCAGKITI